MVHCGHGCLVFWLSLRLYSAQWAYISRIWPDKFFCSSHDFFVTPPDGRPIFMYFLIPSLAIVGILQYSLSFSCVLYFSLLHERAFMNLGRCVGVKGAEEIWAKQLGKIEELLIVSEKSYGKHEGRIWVLDDRRELSKMKTIWGENGFIKFKSGEELYCSFSSIVMKKV